MELNFSKKSKVFNKLLAAFLIQTFLFVNIVQAAYLTASDTKTSYLSPAVHIQQSQVRGLFHDPYLFAGQGLFSETKLSGFLDYFLNSDEGRELQERAKGSNDPASVEKVILKPSVGNNIAIGLQEEIEIEAIIIASANADLTKDELSLSVHTNMDTYQWHDIGIPRKQLSQVLNKNGTPVPGIFYAKIRIKPKKPGYYQLTVKARTKHQENYKWGDENNNPENLHLQVQLFPIWMRASEFHPAYIFVDDLAAYGYRVNWTGLKEFIKNRHEKTGKNVFMLSPFFPIALSSPFTPTSVYAINKRFVDWDNVKDKGKTPLEKFHNFKKSSSAKRRKAFGRFCKKEQIKLFAKFERQRSSQKREFELDIFHYDPEWFSGLDNETAGRFIEEFRLYEQFINLEQMYEFLKLCKAKKIRILGDIPYYRATDGVDAMFNRQYFMERGGKIDSPGFKGAHEQFWGDLAAWNEHWIKEQVASEKKDPRMGAFEYWQTIFVDIFGKEAKEAVISGWRLDALHMYGRGAYQDNSQRLYYDSNLWDEIADYFQKNDLLPVVEQLGGDAHAYYNFQRLGFFQYAFVLDLKAKILNDYIRDIATISRGRAFTVIDTHDSQRWAKEYWGMFENLYGEKVSFYSKDDAKKVIDLLGPAFLAFAMLGPKTETVLLSLGEFGTTAPIKTEGKDYRGVVTLSTWGTENIGSTDLSAWMKIFTVIRKNNSAINNAEMTVIANNDNERLVSCAKAYNGNNLLMLANFSAENKTITFQMPLDKFNMHPTGWFVLRDLVSNEEILQTSGMFQHELAPGQVCVFSVQPQQSSLQTWAEQFIIPYMKDISVNDTIISLIGEYVNADDIARSRIEKVLKELMPVSFEGFALWNWDENKNKEVLIHDKQGLVINNQKPFIVYIRDYRGKERYVSSITSSDGKNQTAVILGLEEGNYTLKFIWPEKKENNGWEDRKYHFRVMPNWENIVKTGRFEDLSLLVTADEFSQYPHNSVTISNGKGSILRVPIRPLWRNPWGETSGFTTKYDGFQANLMQGSPDESRRVLFRGTVDDVSVTINSQKKDFHLEMNNLQNFERFPLPCWTHVLKDGDEEVVIKKTMTLLEGENTFVINFKVFNATSGVDDVEIFVRPDLDMRLHHEVTKSWPGAKEYWDSNHLQVKTNGNNSGFRIFPINGDWKQWHPGFDGIMMTTTKGNYSFASEWHYTPNPLEAERGQDTTSDSYSPGFFKLDLKGKGSSNIIFTVVNQNIPTPDYTHDEVTKKLEENIVLQKRRVENIRSDEAKQDFFVQAMTLGLWQFVAQREEFYTVIAGYPWFSDWGRDTFICFDGILAAGMHNIAKGLIMAFGKFENKGMLPNIITGQTAGNWDTVDAPLLYVLSIKNYIQETGDVRILDERIGERTIAEVIESIVDGYCNGTPNGIWMDEQTKLIGSPSHFTWMDTNYPACTPRQGYTVENNARWFDCLNYVSGVLFLRGNQQKADELKQIAAQVKDNFNKYFWTEREGGYLADNIETLELEQGAEQARKDEAIRPNQLIAVLSDYGLLDEEQKKKVADIVEKKLLVPTGLRTLSEDTSSQDHFPYRGNYEGNEDDSRKPAYHNGTVWPHLFGDWALAHMSAYGYNEESVRYVLPYFAALQEHLKVAGVGSVSEVKDGNFPHWPRGCDAQAWSVAANLAAYMQIRYGKGSRLFETAVKNNKILLEKQLRIIEKIAVCKEHIVGKSI